MYSIVVAAMLTTGTPAPAFGGLFSRGGESCLGGCQGCNGCSGGSCYGCNGCTGCQGGCGGYGFLGIRDFFHNAFSSGSCNGCCGGCNGCYGSMSCYGGCMGGCMGGCQGSYSMGGYGMSSSGYEMPMGMNTSMPMNTYGAMPMNPYGGMPMTQGMPYSMPQGNVMNPVPPLNMPNQLPYGPPPQAADATVPANQATVVVNLPADARLYVEKHLMTLTGTTRAFRTPDLAPGSKYNYTIRMEVERGGKMIEKTENITIEPGKRTQVSFADPGEGGGGLTRAQIAYIQ